MNELFEQINAKFVIENNLEIKISTYKLRFLDLILRNKEYNFRGKPMFVRACVRACA